MKYVLVAVVIAFVTYGQLIIKHCVKELGPFPSEGPGAMLTYGIQALTNVGILSGFLAAFLAALAWVATVSRYDLSSVYPLLSLNFVIVPLCAAMIFGEPLNVFKVAGILVIVCGVFLFSRGI